MDFLGLFYSQPVFFSSSLHGWHWSIQTHSTIVCDMSMHEPVQRCWFFFLFASLMGTTNSAHICCVLHHIKGAKKLNCTSYCINFAMRYFLFVVSASINMTWCKYMAILFKCERVWGEWLLWTWTAHWIQLYYAYFHWPWVFGLLADAFKLMAQTARSKICQRERERERAKERKKKKVITWHEHTLAIWTMSRKTKWLNIHVRFTRLLE